MSNFISLTQKYQNSESRVLLNVNSIVSFIAIKEYTKVTLNILDKTSMNGENDINYIYTEIFVLEEVQYILNHILIWLISIMCFDVSGSAPLYSDKTTKGL